MESSVLFFVKAPRGKGQGRTDFVVSRCGYAAMGLWQGIESGNLEKRTDQARLSFLIS